MLDRSQSNLDNRQIAAQLFQLADLLEISGGNSFRVSAFRRAAGTIEHEPEPVSELRDAGTLTSLPSIGQGIAAMIDEIIATGTCSEMEALLDEVPSTLLTLLGIPGVGPKTVRRLYQELGITDLNSLETAAQSGTIRAMKGFGAKQEGRILEGIAFLKQKSERISIGMALPLARALRDELAGSLGANVEIVGDVRRGEETVDSIELITTASRVDVENALSSFAAEQPTARGQDDVVEINPGSGVLGRIHLTTPDRFGTTMILQTGNAAHVMALADRAGGELPEAPMEAKIYDQVSLGYVVPELRQGTSEIELAAAGTLPQLVELADLRGDLHLHSRWSDGRATIRELAEAARDRGYQYLSVADHSGGLRIAGGLDIGRLQEQRIEIDRVNNEVPEIRLLRSAEVEVHRDGSLDFPDDILAELDIVVASLHSGLRQPRDEFMRRVELVARNPHVDIIAHPSGRIIDRRPGADYDWERLYHLALETGTALEINGDPSRLDLSASHARAAAEARAIITIDSDAHSLAGLDNVLYGVLTARRAGLEARNVLNTRSLQDLETWLHR